MVPTSHVHIELVFLLDFSEALHLVYMEISLALWFQAVFIRIIFRIKVIFLFLLTIQFLHFGQKMRGIQSFCIRVFEPKDVIVKDLCRDSVRSVIVLQCQRDIARVFGGEKALINCNFLPRLSVKDVIG